MLTATPIRRVPRYVVGLFFGCLLLLGAALFSAYGTSWDEPIDRLNGLVSLRFAAHLIAPAWTDQQTMLANVPAVGSHQDSDHGVLFELPLALFDVLRPGHDMRTYYLVRHASVFLVSLIGVWAVFRLASWRWRDERLGLLAATALVLSPRFFAESFYNGKDIPFMALFTLGIYTLVRLLERPTWRRALVHGLVTAAATDVRVLGLLLLPFTYTLLALQAASPDTPTPGRRALGRAGLVYLPALAAGMLAAWPYLWEHPLRRLWGVFVGMSHFNWPGVVLYEGHLIKATELPWHYAPVWISITTPVAYQVAALVGLGVVAAGLLRRPWATLRTPAGRADFLVAGWLLAPLLLVIVFHSVIYDGWRHLYFIYPALLVLAVRGGVAVAQLGRRGTGWHRLALGLAGLAGAEAVFTAGRMVAMHPHQQTYFSYLPRGVVERSFERDYWALSYRQGLEYVVKQQPAGPIFIDVSHLPPLENNKPWLAPADEARLVFAPGAAGRYLITAYRSTSAPYPDSVGREVYALRADGVKIMSVFRRPWAAARLCIGPRPVVLRAMPITTSIRRAPRYVVAAFFGFLLLLGAVLFSGYGVSWDEPVDRLNGLVSLRFAAEQVAPGWAASKAPLQAAPPIQDYPDNDHGVLFELPLALFDMLRPGSDMRTYFLVRHASVFLVSLIGVWALFRLASWRWRDERLGLLAAAALVLSPRFFAESFYNGKDIPFVALFALSMYTLVRLLERPTWRRGVVHALATAAATDIRILALMMVPFTFTLLALQFASNPAPEARRGLRQAGLVYLPALLAGVVAGWPYLWMHTFEHLRDAFVSMSHFRWDGLMLYMGAQVPSLNLPWHYPLVWLSITTPVAYQVAALVGLAVVAFGLLRRPWATLSTPEGRFDILMAGWLVLPLALVIGLHSVIYDGWRHLYFIYPALLLLAVRGGVAVAQLGQRGVVWHRLALGLGVVAGAEAVLTAGRMALMHPHQQTYFSYLPRKVAEEQFERDYWGVSYRQGLEYLVKQHPTGQLSMDMAQYTAYLNNMVWLSAADQARFVLAPDVPGRYFMTVYRGTYFPRPSIEVYAIKADGVKILSINRRPVSAAEKDPLAW